MSRTHDVTISAFDLDRLEFELAAVTEERDRLLEEREQWRMSSVCRELTEQRDRLAAIAGELIEMIRMNVAWGWFFEKCTLEQLDEHLKPWIEKIAAVKGGSDE